jgi:hypothetical protein
MPSYFAAVELYDPSGPSQVDEGETYGGETRMFVLQADDLAEALETLAHSIIEHELTLTRLLHAGNVEDFDDEMLAFDVDIDAMVQTTEDGGKICVSDAYLFPPDPTDGAPTGVFAICLDLFDGEWAEEDEGNYAGHYQLAVMPAPNANTALMQILAFCADQDLVLQGLEGLVDSNAFPFDAYEFEFEEEDPVAEALETGGILLSIAYGYTPEPPRKLDS